MKIGLPKEIKNGERRVALLSEQISELVDMGHEVFVGIDAGSHVGENNALYERCGAKVVSNKEVYNNSSLIVKVKEPLVGEVEHMQDGATCFSYLHLASAHDTREAMIDKNIKGIPWEALKDENGQRFMLAPLSIIAGKLAVIKAEELLLKSKGLFLEDRKVVVYGGGVVGTAAAIAAADRRANVTVIDASEHALKRAEDKGFHAIPANDTSDRFFAISDADVLIGAVLIPGQLAPKVITKDDIHNMAKGSVFVDVAIDQGGCSETSRYTTHSEPTYVYDDIIHYCVPNMPAMAHLEASKIIGPTIMPSLKKLISDPVSLQEFVELENGVYTPLS